MTKETPYPKVSIIMPTYNRAEYILETIESIRQQTYTNWELIIVDDGSDDETEAIIRQIEKKQIIFHKAGRIGIGGKIKNIGLQLSTGELIAFIDSDDLWAVDKLKKQVAALNHFQEAGFCLCNGYNFKKRNEPVEYFYKQKDGTSFGDHFLSFFKSELPGFTQALLLRRECLSQTGGFSETKAFSDVDFIVKLAQSFKGLILYEPLVNRRLHDSNHTNKTWLKNYNEGIELIKSYKDEIPAQVFRTALFRVYINFGESHLKRQSKNKAIIQFFKAWKYQPLSIVPLKKIAKATTYPLIQK